MKQLVYVATLIATLELIALANNIDGISLSASIGALSAIAGYITKTIIVNRKRR